MVVIKCVCEATTHAWDQYSLVMIALFFNGRALSKEQNIYDNFIN